MTEATSRVHCPWCTTRLNGQAAVCHRCGAIKMRPPLSMMQIFFLHPLIASVVAAAGVILLGLSPVKAGGAFVVGWLVLSLIHVAFRQRRRWVQLEPLLLKAEETEQHISHPAPFTPAPWMATVATVGIGLAVIWYASPKSTIESATAATASVPVNQAVATAPAQPAPAMPVDVAVANTPKEALPPTPPSQPWTPVVAAATAPTDMPAPTAPDRSLVMQAQKMLADLGYDVGGVDGKAGPKTRAAIKTFRERAGMGGEDINDGLISALQTAGPSLMQTSIVATTPQPFEAKPFEAKPLEARPASRSEAQFAKAEYTPVPFQPSQPFAAQPVSQPAAVPPPPRAETSLNTASLNREYAARYQPAPAPVAAPAPERRPQQQSNASPSGAPIQALVPVLKVQESNAPMIVDPTSAQSASRDMQAPIRLGPPVRY